MAQTPPVILSIAGFDPSSGAGITADIKTIAAHGCYGVACITALTVQSTTGVKRVEAVSGQTVREILAELAGDVEIAATRIGMLATGEVVDAVTDFLRSAARPNVVFDPVLRSTSGADLLDPKAHGKVAGLLPLVSVISPNLAEAALLTGLEVRNVAEMKVAARKLHDMGATNVIVTGGHLEKPVDVVSMAGAGGCEQTEFTSDRLKSPSTHGTGCAFATALAVQLALGRSIPDAAVLAKAYVTKGIANAYPVGKGVGPINHLFRMQQESAPKAVVGEAAGADPELKFHEH
jgi:hydroxymethylpyrimidine/phosphomethylpyrimidine kinase